MFQNLKDPQNLKQDLARSVIAIGNFDGLHQGHRAVINQALAMGKRLHRPVILLNFEPHPREFFQSDLHIFRLSHSDVKASLAERLGLNAMITLSFNHELAQKSAAEFVTDILIEQFNIAGAVVGYDFQFGAKRGGTPAYLWKAGAEFGFEVEITPEFLVRGKQISSTLIRQKLIDGDIQSANLLLGYEWFIIGKVIHGRQLGRTIGFPTANIRLTEDCLLKHGVYAVKLKLGTQTYKAIANFGRRPTFDNGAPLLEVHVFDFDGDLYNESVDVIFVDFLRPESKFETMSALISQMEVDCKKAKIILST